MFLSAFFPSPEGDSAGVLDAYHILRDLCARHEVTLVTFASEEDQRQLPALQATCKEVFTIPAPALPGTPQYFLYTALSFTSSMPAIARMSHSSEMVRVLRRLVSRHSFDLAHVEFTQMAHYVEFLNGTPAVLDESDIAFVRRERFARTTDSFLARLALWWDTKKLKSYEIGYCGRYDGILVRTDHDRMILRSHLPVSPVEVISPWIDFSFVEAVEEEPLGEDLLFYGAMWRPANEQAALYFLRDIFPLVRRHHQRCRFIVLGSRPSRRLQKCGAEDVQVTGYVPEVAPYYNQAAVVVVPLLSGSGIKGKVIQALACGKPVIATTVGAEGIPATEKDGLFVRDRPQEFAECVLWLIERRRYLEYREPARRFVRRFYDWEGGIERIDALYRQIVQARGRAARVSLERLAEY